MNHMQHFNRILPSFDRNYNSNHIVHPTNSYHTILRPLSNFNRYYNRNYFAG